MSNLVIDRIDEEFIVNVLPINAELTQEEERHLKSMLKLLTV